MSPLILNNQCKFVKLAQDEQLRIYKCLHKLQQQGLFCKKNLCFMWPLMYNNSMFFFLAR